MGTVCHLVGNDNIQDNIHSQICVQLEYGKVTVGNNLTMYTYTIIQYNYLNNNTQSDFYLQLHVHIYG